ncbi:20617_t:CDS:1, partial [Racocetra persica]
SFLQKWNLCDGLNFHGNILVLGRQILTEDGEIFSHTKKEIIHIHTNRVRINELKNMRILLNQDTEEVSIRLHFSLLQVEYRNYKIVDEFTEKIKKALNNPDQKSVRETLTNLFEEYGEFIAINVDIGGALMILYIIYIIFITI